MFYFILPGGRNVALTQEFQELADDFLVEIFIILEYNSK